MRCVFVLACLVGRVAAQPSIRTVGGNIIMNGEDLRFTHNDGIGTPISLTEIANRMATLEAWKIDAAASLAAFAAFKTELALACAPGDMVVGISSTGTVTCEDIHEYVGDAVSDGITSYDATVSPQLVGIMTQLRTGAAETSTVTANVQSLTANVRSLTGNIATLSAATGLNTRNVANLTTNLTLLTAATRPICPAGVQAFVASTFTFRNTLPNRGRHSRAQLTGNSRQYATLSCSHHCNNIFDGRTGNWGTDGAMYRAQNGIGGGMEVRFERPTHIARWNVHCIRNTGSPTSNSGRGTACYSSGSYDFQYVLVEYWLNNNWNRAGFLNSRNSANWQSNYAGLARGVKAQNWRFYFSGSNGNGRCQHPNGDCAPHVSEIELFGC